MAPGEIHPNLGVIRVGAQLVPMVFGDWNPEGSAEQLLATAEWQALHALLTEFHHLCRAEGILPVLLYIPSKSQVYAEYATAHSGHRFLQAAARQRPIRTNMVAAITTLAQQVELPLINLLPYFEQQAEAGRLLYYPFDTHWSGEGIQAAADIHLASTAALARHGSPRAPPRMSSPGGGYACAPRLTQLWQTSSRGFARELSRNNRWFVCT